MAEKSNHWAILDRQTVFHLGSKYSVLLFQHISSLTNLDHVTSKTFSIPDLRAVLGIPEGKLDRFVHLRQRAIDHAISEINQLSRLTLTATPHKIGRTVASVTIAWEVKPDPTEAKAELNRPKVGVPRGEMERPRCLYRRSPPLGAFPSIALDAHWRALFEAHVTRIQGGHLPDSKLVCDAFRKARATSWMIRQPSAISSTSARRGADSNPCWRVAGLLLTPPPPNFDGRSGGGDRPHQKDEL